VSARTPEAVTIALTAASGGNRPPVAARAVYAALPLVPPHALASPGGREFRNAVNRALPEAWRLTRSDITGGVRWLKLYGLLPGRESES
jgi:hypothetical protein